MHHVPDLTIESAEMASDGPEYRLVFPEPEPAEVDIHDEVVVHSSRGPMPATVVAKSEDGLYTVAFYGEMANRQQLVKVRRDNFKMKTHPTEGESAKANFQGRGEWFAGSISHVRPNADQGAHNSNSERGY